MRYGGMTCRPDVALLGVVIPEIGGVEAAIKLLEICPETKIVLVTESVRPEALQQLEAHGYHFPMLPAPFTREELHSWCSAALAHRPCCLALNPSTNARA